MGSTAQARAVENYRKRLTKRGMVRFEVLGLKKDRELVRTVARKLAEDGPEAAQIRATVSEKIDPDTRRKGGFLKMLRDSPLMGVELNLTRRRVAPRKVEL
ncbi:MAG: hypothetical protein ABSF23_04485 [Terracidiphilus sp.]|jgi:hypothetical protein